MAGNKLEQAKKALLFCVDNLNNNDRFELMRFSTEVEPLFDKLVDAADKNRRRAREFIQDLKPMGGTAIDDALRKALAARPDEEERPFILIFLTDGRPTIGLTDETQIVDNVTRSNKGNTRIFCFGIGTDVNTHLLDKITEETKAFSQYVLPEEDIEVKVSSFYTKIKEPVLASPKVTFPEGAHVTKLYPSPLPDLFKGEQVVLVGRYANAADGAISIEGNVEGQTRKFAYDAKLPDKSAEHEFIPRLWATRRVGYLLDEIRLRGENKELKDEVSELARKYNIVTPYTAYLIIEDETRRNVPTVMRSLDQLNRTSGVNEFQGQFYRFSNDKDGGAAVAGARSAYDLKVAEAPTEAIRRGRSDSYGLADAAVTAPSGSLGGRGPALARSGAYSYNAPASMPVETAKRLSAFEEQSRFVQGRAFYRNGSKWIDSSAQNMKGGPVRIKFDSPEYFDLMKKHPEAAGWLSLGTNLQLVLNNTFYEIYETE
jgi:Ca-activated chloride channel family protein